MTTTEDKIDALLRSVEALKKVQLESQQDVCCKLSQLESDVTASQDSVVQCICIRMKCK